MDNIRKAVSTLSGTITQHFLGPESYSSEDLIKLIGQDPTKALGIISCFYKQFSKGIDQLDTSEKNNAKKNYHLLEEHEKKCPLILINECTLGDEGPCIFKRAKNPYREKFEFEVVSAFNEKLTSSKEPIQYIGFGAGGMFQDLVILTKTLTQHPEAQINIHLIDYTYNCYLNLRLYLKSSREIYDTCNDEPTESAIRYLLKAENIEQDEQTKDTIRYNLKKEGRLFRQFISALQKNFPKAQLSLFAHESTTGYLSYINAKKIAYPDIITGADLQSYTCSLYGAIYHYKTLCFAALQKKPNSKNFLLCRKSMNRQVSQEYNKIIIATHALTELKNSEKVVLNEGHPYDKSITQYWVTKKALN